MFCTSCGTKLGDGSQFCRSCGAGIKASHGGIAGVDHLDDGDKVEEERAGKAKSLRTRSFYGNCSWFKPAEQPGNADSIPEAFTRAKRLWDVDGEGNFEKIVDLIGPYLRARYIPSGVSNGVELSGGQADELDSEIEATEVRLVGIDFKQGPIPIAKAEAQFEIGVVEEFPDIDLEEWQQSNTWLSDGLVFYWDIPRSDETEGLDFTFGDNQGVEFLPLDR